MKLMIIILKIKLGGNITMNSERKIKELIDRFEGKVCLYAIDEQNNIIKNNENEIVETASCIKLFILIEYYNQILKNEKSRDDIINYSVQNDYVENGSGIIQFLKDLNLSSINMATLMMIVSDNIATNKMIEYLGFDNINNTIKKLGFKNTFLNAKKLDFNIYSSIGKTTAYEYAKAYEMILKKKILTPDLCDEITSILSHQTKNDMIIRFLSPKYLEEKGCENAFIKYIATKSGGLGDEGKEDIINCRNDGGIISTTIGNYIISIFINNFSDHYFYADNPASLLGAKINKIIFETFEQNKGSIK